MTNFKNPFASIKHRFHKISVSGLSNSGTKLCGSKILVSLSLLLFCCFSFASTALAAEPSGMATLPSGPPTPPSSSHATNLASLPSGPPTPSIPNNATGLPSLPSGPPAGSSSATGMAYLPSGPPPPSVGSSATGMDALPNGPPVPPTAFTNAITESEEQKDALNTIPLIKPLNFIDSPTSGTTGATGTSSNYITQAIQNFWVSTGLPFFSHLGVLVKLFIKQGVEFLIKPIVQQLTNTMVQFAYNPDVSVGQDPFSLNVQALAGWIRYLCNDLLLLFFILSIWRYWATAAWKGGSIMGAVARIIVAASATTAWPTIYHYVILISNSLTQYLFDKHVLNATTISSAVAGAIAELATNNAPFSFLNSILSSGNITVGTVLAVPAVAIAQLILVAAIGLAIIGSIIVFFTMKVIQIVIVISAFVFAPFFLCMLVSPDTDSVVSGFIRCFVETSLWTFIWTIFLMLFVFALGVTGGADFNGVIAGVTPDITTNITQNPSSAWCVLFLQLGFLQAMIQTPGYLSRGKISEAGEFLELFALWKLGKSAGNFLFGADGKMTQAFRYAKRNNPLTGGKDNASTDIGGAGFLPTGGKQLASLNNNHSRGIASVLGMSGGRLGLSGASGGAGGAILGGGSAAPGGSLLGAGGLMSSSNSNSLASATSRAIGQFGGSMGSGSPGGFGNEEDGSPLIQKTSLGLPANSNPWHDARNRKDGAVDYLAAYNAQKIRTGQVNLEQNKKNPSQNTMDFDDSGTIKKIKHREGASAAEIGMLSTVAALATIPYSDGKGHTDARAVTATNSAVKDKGKWHAPLGRRISWGLSKNVPEYARNIEKDRLEREKVQARIEGASAYVKGESGNAYTNFLKWKLGGPMDDNTRSMLAYTSERTDATLGGFNLNRDSGIQRLARMGMDINPVTMGLASHEGIIGMRPNEQPQAIPAALRLVNSHLASMGIDPSNKEIWGQGIHWAAADGVLRGLSPQHIRAARAIADIQGLSAVNPNSVNHVMSLHRTNGQGESSQSYEKAALEAAGYAQPYQGRTSRI